MSTAPDLTADLEPVRATLLDAARADATDLLHRAEQAGAHTRAAAEQEAAQILAKAREVGAADAGAALAAERTRARQEARTTVLAARREAYEQLRAAARTAVARLADEPGYPAVRQRLADTARRVLGAQAQITDVPGGGVRGQAPGRRLDLSLTDVADRAVDEYAGRMERT